MSIRNRIEKLEQTKGPGLVIYVTDPFTGEDDEEPVIREALVNLKTYERQSNEGQDEFMKRVNPAGQRCVHVESDAGEL